MRTIFIRRRDGGKKIAVVVKPRPRSGAYNKLNFGNINGARGYANALNRRFGWQVVEQ